MIPHFKLIAYGVIAAVVISLGIYAKVIYNRSLRVPELERQLVEADLIVQEVYAEVERNGKRTLKSLELQHELQTQRDAARDGAASLASRLRSVYANQALSHAAEVAPGPSGVTGAVPSGVGPDEAQVDAVVTEFIAACQLDAIDKIGWDAWYDLVPCELKAEGC
jgi:hypothetical protein